MADYKRNPKKVLSVLKTLPNGAVITTEPMKIIFPMRFRDIKLAIIGEVSHVFGLFLMVVGDQSGLMSMNAYLELGKAKITKEVYYGEDYYAFNYEAGDVVYRTKEIVARTALIFTAIDEFMFKGKVPWYVGYDDLGKLFATAVEYTGTRALMLPAVQEFLTAYIARKKADLTKFLRDGSMKREDFARDKFAWVPLRSVYLSAPGTLNKISGAYFADGVVSAIVKPSKRIENIEGVIRA